MKKPTGHLEEKNSKLARRGLSRRMARIAQRKRIKNDL